MTMSRTRPRWQTVASVLFTAAGISACHFAPGPPASMKGDVSVRVINASHGTLCALHGTNSIYASIKDSEHSWLVRSTVDQGKFIDFKVKPGTYEFSPQICDKNGSRLSNAQPIPIRGPTEIVVGDETFDAPPQPGFQRVKARFARPTCSAHGFSCDSGDLPCCSGFKCIRGAGGGVCRWPDGR